MTRRWALVLVALAGCRGGDSKTRRTGSAAPVEILNTPQLPDAGAGGGPSADEIEPNDGEEVASPIALGGTARGRLETDADIDFYRLDVDRPGVLQVSLSGIDGVDLALDMTDSAGASVGRSDRTGVRLKEGIPNAGVTPGRYTLIVRHAPKKKQPKPKPPKKGTAAAAAAAAEAEKPAAPAPVYELSAQIVPLPLGGEREPDDDRGTANDLIVADNASGFLGWTDDKDVWKLSVETLSEKNALDIQVSAIEGVTLTLEIADGIGTLLATRKGLRGQPLTVHGVLPVVPDGAPPFYYLTLRGDRSNPETAYTLHATARVLGPDAELEPNDNVDKPQAIAPDRTVVHASWGPGDIDCFAIAVATTPRTVDVSIDTPSEIDLAAELLVDGKVVATANKGGKGVLEKVSAPVPAGAKAVVRVKNPDAAATAEASYDVSVQESSATGDNAP
jgi:hypothetical protein